MVPVLPKIGSNNQLKEVTLTNSLMLVSQIKSIAISVCSKRYQKALLSQLLDKRNLASTLKRKTNMKMNQI